MYSNELPERTLSSRPDQARMGHPPRECPHCKTMYSYSNLKSHVKRCKVRVGINIVAKENEIKNLIKKNEELQMERDHWMLRYEEVKTMNDQLIEAHSERKGVIPITTQNRGDPSVMMDWN